MDDNHYTTADESDMVAKVEQDALNVSPQAMMRELNSSLANRKLLADEERVPVLNLSEATELDKSHSDNVADLEQHLQHHKDKNEEGLMFEFPVSNPKKTPENEDELDDETLRILSDVILAQYREVTVTKERAERDKAIIQSLVYRKRLEEEHAKRVTAAVNIQKLWKGYQLRQLVLPRFRAAMIRFRKRQLFRRWKFEAIALKHSRKRLIDMSWLAWLVRSILLLSHYFSNLLMINSLRVKTTWQ
jgi:hypothetical protein